MRLPPLPASTVTRALVQASLAATVAATLAGCDGTQTVDGILAPSPISSGGINGSGGGGSTVTVVRGKADLLGSWTRVSGSGSGLLVEQTFTFAADGSGARTTITRTQLGVEIGIDRAPFTWDAGGGILQFRFLRQGAADNLRRASYVLLTDLGATVLQLDGDTYVRAGGG